MILALVLTATLGAPAVPAAAPPPRPIVFVHGSAGSAAQFQTQAKRFAANGYPIGSVEAHEYDSPNIVAVLPQVYAGLDARIDRLLSTTGADRVDLAAHSLGTFVMQGYLSSTPQRAARVAHYVNLDGRPAAAPPGGVPTLAIWGEGDPTRTIAGATNVSLPAQSHTQTVSSVESFREMYRFFTGQPPRTTRVVPTASATVAGRAVLFPSNAGVSAGRLDVYPVGARTGRRLSTRPQHSVAVGGDGSFGPLTVHPGSRYEFALVREGIATHHFYFAPFRRSDAFVRLLAGRPAPAGTGPPRPARPSRHLARPAAARPPHRTLRDRGIPAGTGPGVAPQLTRSTRATDSARSRCRRTARAATADRRP